MHSQRKLRCLYEDCTPSMFLLCIAFYFGGNPAYGSLAFELFSKATPNRIEISELVCHQISIYTVALQANSYLHRQKPYYRTLHLLIGRGTTFISCWYL